MNSELVEAARQRNRELAEKKAAVGKALAGVGKGLLRGAKKHPFAAGFGYVSVAPTAINPLPILKWPMAEKVPAARQGIENTARVIQDTKAARGVTDAAGTYRRRGSVMGKAAHVQGASMFTEEEVRQVQRIGKCLEKTAAGASILGQRAVNPQLLRNIALLGSLGVGIGAGSQLGSYGVSKVVAKGRSRNEKKFYGKMIKADPGLRREPGAREMFNIVNRASPYLASEPTIAAATVRSMLDSPALDERKLQQLLTTEKLRQDTEFPWRQSGKEVGRLGDVASLALI